MMSGRILQFLGGLAGAAGVALSAAASHAEAPNLGIAGSFLLMHAPALLAFSLLPGASIQRSGAAIVALGLAVFAGDLAARHYLGGRLFPYAAPFGGGALILGWLVIALSALAGPRTR